MYYKGHIYFSCYEAGKKTTYQTTFNNREKGSNVIYVYNLDGILQKTLYISNKDAYGEIEGTAMDSDGKLIAGYNTDIWTSISFYSSNYLKENEKEPTVDDKDDDKIDKIEEIEQAEPISDNTIAKTELPKAGKQNILVIFIVSTIIVSGVLIKKLKEYKYIK